MGLQSITITRDWPDTPSYTASGETDISVTNPTGRRLYLAVTSTAVAPDAPPMFGLPVDGLSDRSLVLLDGESLWVAAESLANGKSTEVGLQD